jgi:hypothetical protein
MPGTSDTFTTSNRLSKQPTGGNYNEWGTFLNDNMDLIDTAVDGNKIITLSSTSYTLSTANGATDEARFRSLSFIGSPGGTATVTANNAMKMRDIENRTTGGYPIVFTNGTGSSVTILNNSFVRVQCDMAGNMRVASGNQMAGRRITGLGTATATDDAARFDQVSFRGYQTIMFDAQAITPIGTLGTIPGGTAQVLTATVSQRMIPTILFSGTALEYATVTINKMPKSWDGGPVLISFSGLTTSTVTASGSNAIEMKVGLMSVASGQYADQAFTLAAGSCIGTSAGQATTIWTSTLTATVSGGTASSEGSLGVLIYRNSTSAADTLDDNFSLTGMSLKYYVSAPNDN